MTAPSHLHDIPRYLPIPLQRQWSVLIERICHGSTIWREPFASTLSLATSPAIERFQLAAVWATNMVSGSYRFPAYVATLASRADNDAVRHSLLENAWDESGGVHHKARSHYWLAVRLASLLGLSDDEIVRIVPLAGATTYMAEHLQRCIQGDFEFALGMICLIEEFTTPEFSLVFRAMLATCNTGLGISSDDFVLRGGAEYFTANISDDERHREEMPRVVATRLAARGVDLEDELAVQNGLVQVVGGMVESIRLRGQFFQSIYDFVERGGTYRDLVAAPETRRTPHFGRVTDLDSTASRTGR